MMGGAMNAIGTIKKIQDNDCGKLVSGRGWDCGQPSVALGGESQTCGPKYASVFQGTLKLNRH